MARRDEYTETAQLRQRFRADWPPALPGAPPPPATAATTATAAELLAGTETAGRLISPATLADSVDDKVDEMAFFLGI